MVLITTSRCRTDAIVAGIALVTAVVVLALPPSPYLASALRPLALGVAGTWLVVRALVCDRTLTRWRALRRNMLWTVTPASLERYHG